MSKNGLVSRSMSLPFLLTAAAPSPDLLLKLVLHALGEHWLAWLGLASLAIIAALFKLPKVRGALGEAIVRTSLSRLDPVHYRVLHNVYVPHRSGEGAMAQIDHVIVSVHGIFVIETKHFSGWLYGRPSDSMWTRTNFRHKQHFRNPLKQNQGHVNALAFFLDLPRNMFHSIVCFTGDATLKTPMPPDVITSGLRPHIESRQEALLDEKEVARLWERLKDHDTGMHKSSVGRLHIARLAALARRRAVSPP